MSRGDDVDLAIGTQLVHEAVEQSRFGQRLIALDINNEIELLCFPGDLSDAVGAALMMWRGHCHLGAPIESSVGDPHVVRGDNDCVQFLRAPTALPYMSENRFVCNEMQRFSRKTRGPPTSRNSS